VCTCHDGPARKEGAVGDRHGALAPVEVEEADQPGAAGEPPAPAGRWRRLRRPRQPELVRDDDRRVGVPAVVESVVPRALGERGDEGVDGDVVSLGAARCRAEERRRRRERRGGRGAVVAGRGLGDARVALPREGHEGGGGGASARRGRGRRRAEAAGGGGRGGGGGAVAASSRSGRRRRQGERRRWERQGLRLRQRVGRWHDGLLRREGRLQWWSVRRTVGRLEDSCLSLINTVVEGLQKKPSRFPRILFVSLLLFFSRADR
jgi:hypothetical protein